MLSRRKILLLVLLCITGGLRAEPEMVSGLQDLYYGEALFYAYQEAYFEAITRLDIELQQHYQLDEPGRDPLSIYRGTAEFSVGDLELSYRMHQQAGRALDRVFSESVEQTIKNEAAYRMARIFFQKRYFVNTLHALDLMRGELSKNLAEDAAMLRAQAEMTQQNFSKAVELLKPIRRSTRHAGYVNYNLGVAYIRSGDIKRGAELLDQVGLLAGDSEEMAALRDKANLTVGYNLLEEGYAQQARPYFERIRLNGPFSNKALLWAGWADLTAGNSEAALVPWSLLHKRDSTDSAVQEALLALPYAYGQLEAYGRAALLYGEAVEALDKEIDRLDGSIDSIMQGKLLLALQQIQAQQATEFLNRIKALADAPETRYLLELMASHDFQESVKNYRDVMYLQNNVNAWQNSITAYQDIIQVRRAYYEPLLPEIERKFKLEDERMQRALNKRELLAEQLSLVQRLRDPKALATTEELHIERGLQALERRLGRLAPQPEVHAARQRLQRLQGVLQWQIYNDYEQRLDRAYRHLQALNTSIDELQIQHQRVVRFKREAYQSFEGYAIPFRRLNTRLSSLQARLAATLAQQGRYLEKRAVLELDGRRQKLADYQSKARFALAESYDRATRKQEQEEAEALQNQLTPEAEQP